MVQRTLLKTEFTPLCARTRIPVRFSFIKTLFWTRMGTLFVIWIDRYVISLRPRSVRWPAASRVVHVPFSVTCNLITCSPASHVTSRVVAVYLIFLFIVWFVWFPVNLHNHYVDLVFRQDNNIRTLRFRDKFPPVFLLDVSYVPWHRHQIESTNDL